LDRVRLHPADLEGHQLEIRLTVDDELLSGQLTATETRLGPDAEQLTILFAEGAVSGATSPSPTPLRFGREITSGSVHRRADTSVVHAVCTALELRVNSRIDLTTNDSAFDGRFRVVELRYCFDAIGGGTVEFTAKTEPTP
jgi:hypothetical protein